MAQRIYMFLPKTVMSRLLNIHHKICVSCCIQISLKLCSYLLEKLASKLQWNYSTLSTLFIVYKATHGFKAKRGLKLCTSLINWYTLVETSTVHRHGLCCLGHWNIICKLLTWVALPFTLHSSKPNAVTACLLTIVSQKLKDKTCSLLQSVDICRWAHAGTQQDIGDDFTV